MTTARKDPLADPRRWDEILNRVGERLAQLVLEQISSPLSTTLTNQALSAASELGANIDAHVARTKRELSDSLMRSLAEQQEALRQVGIAAVVGTSQAQREINDLIMDLAFLERRMQSAIDVAANALAAADGGSEGRWTSRTLGRLARGGGSKEPLSVAIDEMRAAASVLGTVIARMKSFRMVDG